MYGADGRFLETLQSVFEMDTLARVIEIGALRTCPVELFAQADFQLTGGLMRESYSDDGFDRSAVGQHAHDSADQLRSLAGTGRSFHDQALAHRIAYSLAGGLVIGQNRRSHGIFLRSWRAYRESFRFFPVRTSSLGPQTGR